jgi:hypothetical protein
MVEPRFFLKFACKNAYRLVDGFQGKRSLWRIYPYVIICYENGFYRRIYSGIK